MNAPQLEPHCGSWIIIDLETGNPVLETFSGKVAGAINRKRYDVQTAATWLAGLNMPKPA